MIEAVRSSPPWPYNIFYSRDTAIRVENVIKQKVPEARVEVVDNPEKIKDLTGKPPSDGQVLVHLEIPQDKSLQIMTALLESVKEPTV